jgi:HD-GYP domain-containing protein (c-di-GMP phosphodiesterase class II)
VQVEFDIEAAIAKLKTEINVADPSLEDVKKILRLLTSYVKSKTMSLNNRFKEERRKRFPHDRRFKEMDEYFRFSSEGLNALQNSIMSLQREQTQLMATIGISQATVARYGHQLGAFMQELVFDSDVTVEEVRKSIEMKTDYLRDHGQRLVEALIEISASLSMHEKQNIALFLNVVLSDEVFESEPALDKDDLDMAYGTLPSMQRSTRTRSTPN